MRHLFITRLYPLLYGLWLHRYLLVLPIIIMPFLMTIGGFLKTKYYYSETTILVQEAALLNPFLEDLSISMNLQHLQFGKINQDVSLYTQVQQSSISHLFFLQLQQILLFLLEY